MNRISVGDRCIIYHVVVIKVIDSVRVRVCDSVWFYIGDSVRFRLDIIASLNTVNLKDIV